jgi:hypothetical protein
MLAARDGPVDELLELGITEYPRHVRYDKSQERFLIENNHPVLRETKQRVNGTRKGSIYQRYVDILYIGAELDEQYTSVHEDDYRCAERKKCINLCNSYNAFLMDLPIKNSSDKDKISDRIIPIAELYNSFQDISSYKMHIDHMWYLKENATEGLDDNLKDLMDPNTNASVYEENGFVLTKKMLKSLPNYLYFRPPRKTSGCNFEYDFKDPETKKITTTMMTSSVTISLEEKYNMALHTIWQ